VLQTLLEGFLYQGQGAVLVPHRQLQTQHALDDAVLLSYCQKTLLVGQINHEGHIDVDRLPVKQLWQYSLWGQKRREEVHI